LRRAQQPCITGASRARYSTTFYGPVDYVNAAWLSAGFADGAVGHGTSDPDVEGVRMTYIDGFVAAVPTANKQKFIDHAKKADSVFVELGANRVLECWGDDVPEGTVTDFRRAVKAKDDETVIFSWIEWPDKATRDKAMPKMMEDPRTQPDQNPMPFDGKRLVYGGFSPIVEVS
jgi:uncharacterized protein YbaA (DUF1428 family)